MGEVLITLRREFYAKNFDGSDEGGEESIARGLEVKDLWEELGERAVGVFIL